MASRTVVNTKNAPQPIGAYSQAIRFQPGSLLAIAGQVALDAQGNLVGKGDAAAQTRQVLRNLQAVLASQGATFSDVVELTSYVVGRAAIQPFIQARTELYPELFPDGNYPANTLLVIDGLVQEDFLVEIKALAVLP